MKLVIPFPSSAAATVVKRRMVQWVWSTKCPHGISHAVACGPSGPGEFLSQVTLQHRLLV